MSHTPPPFRHIAFGDFGVENGREGTLGLSSFQIFELANLRSCEVANLQSLSFPKISRQFFDVDTQCECVFVSPTIKQPSSNLQARKLPPFSVCAI